MIDVTVGKPLPNTAGHHSKTNCLTKHESADWTLNRRAVAVQWVGKRLQARGVAPHAAAKGNV